MNQKEIEEMEEVIKSIFTSPFSNLLEKYHNQIKTADKEKELLVYTGDIIDFMNQHKTDYKQDMAMLCGILVKLVNQAKKKVPELRFENEDKYRDNNRR